MPKVISDHTKNVKLYINFSSLFIIKSLLNVSLYTGSAFISHTVYLGKTLSSWYKYSGPYLIPKFMWQAQISQFVFNIFPTENIFFPILSFFLKLEVMENIIHYVKFEIWTKLFYVNYLSYFQQRIIIYDINFPNSSIESGVRFS